MTAFGAFLDPVADKLMVAIALVLLVERHDTLLFTLAACVIIGREIVDLGPARVDGRTGERTSVAVSYIGKVKTAFQMLAITGLLAIDPARDESWLLALCYLVLYTPRCSPCGPCLSTCGRLIVIRDMDNPLNSVGCENYLGMFLTPPGVNTIGAVKPWLWRGAQLS